MYTDFGKPEELKVEATPKTIESQICRVIRIERDLNLVPIYCHFNRNDNKLPLPGGFVPL